jgi:2-keto-3-deoxy-L-rhamnonate aldolase RhmA
MSTDLQITGSEHQGILGTFATLGIQTLELLCTPNMQVILIDAQHGSWSLDDLKQSIFTAHTMQVHPIIRLPVNGQWMIESLLDAGCYSLLFPMVNSADQAMSLIRACYYPPVGLRSQSTSRASLLSKGNYRQTFNDRFSLLVMIEHVDAVETLSDILDSPHIAGCMIGPTDLASSMPDNSDANQLEDLIQQSLQQCKTNQKLVGITAGNINQARERFKQGFDMVLVSTDRKMLIQAMYQFDQ